MKRFFVCALLACFIQNSNVLISAPRAIPNRFALSACHSIGGVMQFPASLNALPKFPLYCSGKKLTTELDQSKNVIHYTAPKGSYQYEFHIIITPSIDFEMIDNEDDSNTVAYLKIPKDQKYKYFYAHLAPTTVNENNKETQEPAPFEWIIEEKSVEESGRIPDNAIIIVCNPDFVESVQGGNYRDLPLIKIRSDLVQFAGSEAKIHDHLNEILLGSIDIDTIHTTARPEPCIKISHNKIFNTRYNNMNKEYTVIGIETSCDETSVAIYNTTKKLLSLTTYTQIEIHKAFGGVIPEIASRSSA